MLQSIRLRTDIDEQPSTFPWTLNVVRSLEEVRINKPVTFFVGDNGSGKSTLLEALAYYLDIPVAGAHRIEEDQSMRASVELGKQLFCRQSPKFHHGMLARAEDFIGFARKVKEEIKGLQQEIQEIKDTFTGGDLSLAVGAIQGQLNGLTSRYGADLEAISHGEGFLKLFQTRITGKGIYLIDEPEAALSPLKQISLLYIIQEKVALGCQFIIATHSPIIMGMPDAQLLWFGPEKIEPIEYKNTEHYRITKSYLDHPGQYFKEG